MEGSLLSQENEEDLVYSIWLYSFFGASFTVLLSGLSFRKWSTYLCLFVLVTSFFFSYHLIPSFFPSFLRNGLYGVDINKTSGLRVPEGFGVLCGLFYVVCVCFITFVWFFFGEHPSSEILKYFVSLFCCLFMLLLGFVDDVLELRWRYKLILPFFSILPILLVLPVFSVGTRGHLFDFFFCGPFAYGVYVLCFGIYCSNTINIYAGINGIECLQSYVIVVSFLVYNHFFVGVGADFEFVNFHLFSFLGPLLSLMAHNLYPSRLFVGDSFTYFAGMTFAVVAILTRKSVLLFLIMLPQLFNFIVSVPQILHIIPIPRHRVPQKVIINGKLYLEDSHNHTIINYCLRLTGPIQEKYLALILATAHAILNAIILTVAFIITKRKRKTK